MMDESLSLVIRVADVNPHIVCSLCAGYFVDATSITECLHTFCKSCIVKYLQSSKYCPQCNMKIHETQPLLNLKRDQVMQDIVYKLVPQLYENEEKRKQHFYKSRRLPRVKRSGEESEENSSTLSSIYDDPQGHYYQNDEQVCFCLDRYTSYPMVYENDFILGLLPQKFVRCSGRARVMHLKFLLVHKLNIPSNLEVEILCNECVLPADMCLKHIWLAHWYGKVTPIGLYYRINLNHKVQSSSLPHLSLQPEVPDR